VPRIRDITIQFPAAGLVKSHGFQTQPPWSTPLSLNVWVIDPTTGRMRGGSRPPVDEIGDFGASAPYAWCPANFVDSGGTQREGIAITHAGGTNISLDGASWGVATERPEITINPGTTFASCAVYHPYLIQARGGGTVYQKLLNAATAENTLQFTVTNGSTVPTNCGIVLTHADRLWLMGKTDAPGRVYASAVGDPSDWDDTDPTEGGAWTNSGAEGGHIGDLISAGISHDNVNLLIGSPNSIYCVRGNPRVNGVKRVSHSVGPVMQNAWCKGIGPSGENHTYVVTKSGVNYIPAGDPMSVLPLSEKPLPNELLGINPGAGDRVCIGYDHRWRSLHICVDFASGSDVNYSYHIPTDSWWLNSYGSTWHLFPTFPKIQTADKSSMLLVNTGGEVHQFDRTNIGVGAELFDSYVWIGPIKLGGANEEGIVATLKASLAQSSGAANWQVYVGNSAEEAFNSTAAFTGTAWTYDAGPPARYLSYESHPRTAGAYAYLKVYDADNARFLVEEILMGVQAARGRRRI
jgi:hypothetical protein